MKNMSEVNCSHLSFSFAECSITLTGSYKDHVDRYLLVGESNYIE